MTRAEVQATVDEMLYMCIAEADISRSPNEDLADALAFDLADLRREMERDDDEFRAALQTLSESDVRHIFVAAKHKAVAALARRIPRREPRPPVAQPFWYDEAWASPEQVYQFERAIAFLFHNGVRWSQEFIDSREMWDYVFSDCDEE